jgi:hypothetical protein
MVTTQDCLLTLAAHYSKPTTPHHTLHFGAESDAISFVLFLILFTFGLINDRV